MRALYTILLLFFCSCRISAQGFNFSIAEYNVENLFDCSHDSLKNDYEYLPDGIMHWSKGRYWKKLNAVARGIVSICSQDDGTFRPVDLIALCEVENDSVLEALTKRSLLKGAKYEYLITNSPDIRGIDVALLYSRFTFRPLHHESLRVDTINGMRPTRDVLYVKGLMPNDDTLHVFVVHAPSRRDGVALTDRFRLKVTERVTAVTDSIVGNAPKPYICILGDFNDYGKKSSSLNHLRTKGFTDVTEDARGKTAKGTYKYKGIWNSLDHIFVSKPLLDHFLSARIVDDDSLTEEDKTYYGRRPSRFLMFNKLNGGTSDHLPLLSTFHIPDSNLIQAE